MLAALPGRDVDQAGNRVDRGVVRSRPNGGPLGHQGRHHCSPTRPQFADPVGIGNSHFIQENLVEMGLARHLAQRSHRHARGLHLDQEHCDSGVLACVWVGSGEQLTNV